MSRVVRNSQSSGKNGSPRNNALTLLLPILAAGVVLILILKAMFGGSDTTQTTPGANFVTITPKSANSEIYIYMSGDSKKQIDGATKMIPTDNRMEVRSGDADISIEGSATKLSADKLTELAYRWVDAGKHVFELMSSYVWVESTSADTVFKLKNFTVTAAAGSVFALSQNAVGSNAYILKGNVSVATEASSTTVSLNQMITVLASEAKTAKLPDEIRPIDSFFKTSDIYIKHNGDSFLANSGNSGDAWSGSTASGSVATNGKVLVFVYPEDETTVEGTTVDFEGKIGSAKVTKITLNDKEARIDAAARSFSYKGFPLPESENNIVYRAFDADGVVISKGVLTIRSNAKKAVTDETKKPTVTTYPISDKDFRIVTPATNPFKTTDDVVRIQGSVKKGAVKFITVNGFRLSKFAQFSTSWYYSANKSFGNMNDGINTYDVKYYGENDELLSSSMVMIVKEPKDDVLGTDTPTTTPTTSTPSATTPKPSTSSTGSTTNTSKPL